MAGNLPSGTTQADIDAAFDATLDDECPRCGGEGFVFDCFDGCCEDADYGCDDCTRACPECKRR